MKENGWKTWAIAALTALVVGGGASGFYSDSKLHALEEKLELKIEAVQRDSRDLRDRDYDVMMDISRTVVEIKTMVQDLKEHR